jgi:signal transduction histidine kinase
MLETLISDLLDLAKIDNNEFKLNLKYYNLVKTIQQSLEM